MSDLQDPFAFVRDEVEQSVKNVQALYTRWQELLGTSGDKDELTWTTNELESQLKNIDWDLVDLTDTITAVEEEPSRFKIAPGEIENRKLFISRTKEAIHHIRTDVTQRSKQQSQAAMRQELKRKKDFAADVKKSDDSYLGGSANTMDVQQIMERRQDAQLDIVHERVAHIGDIALEMNNELERQGEQLADFEDEMKDTDTRLNDTVNRLEKLMRLSSDKKKMIVIVLLLIVAIGMIIYYIWG